MLNPDIYYGRGMSYPAQVSLTGGVSESAGVLKVEESIRIILGTQYGERLMRPTFGCNLKSLVFAPNNDVTANLARYYVEDGLTRWEPRIDLVSVNVATDNLNAILLIEINFKLKATQEVQSMIYPFYLEQH
jgi:phage baseplate assembly protein W